MESVKENGVVNGIKSGGEVEECEGCDRPFSHVEKIVLNIKEGIFSRMTFSISCLKRRHKASFIKVMMQCIKCIYLQCHC